MIRLLLCLVACSVLDTAWVSISMQWEAMELMMVEHSPENSEDKSRDFHTSDVEQDEVFIPTLISSVSGSESAGRMFCYSRFHRTGSVSHQGEPPENA